MITALAVSGLAGLEGRARADQWAAGPPLRPVEVVYGLSGAAPTFEPRSRVQRATPPEPAAAPIRVIRGYRVADGPALPAVFGRSLDPGLAQALAALCRLDGRDALALGPPGDMAIRTRF